jgi:hypothetical protein
VCFALNLEDQTLTATFHHPLIALRLRTRLGKEKRPLELITATLRHIVVAHTGQSSQLFSVTTGGNAQFLATIDVGVNVTLTNGLSETERLEIPLNIAARH